MAVKRRRRRGSGSLEELKRHLWAILLYNMDTLEDDERPHVLRQKASNCAVQAGLAWLKATEVVDIEQRLAKLESAAAERNGHAKY